MDVSCRKVDKILHKEGESFTCTLSLLQILHVPCIKKGFVFTAFEEPVFSWDVLRFVILWYLLASQIFSIQDKQ